MQSTTSPGRKTLLGGALLVLLALYLSVWPPGTAHARMNEPVPALTVWEDSWTGNAAPLSTATFTLDSARGAGRATFSVHIQTGETDSAFGYCWRESGTDNWHYVPLNSGTSIAATEGEHTGIWSIRPGVEYGWYWATSTRATVLIEILVDGVS